MEAQRVAPGARDKGGQLRHEVHRLGKLPLDQMLIETDSPYLTPVPFRGKRNAPFHVKLVAEKIGQIKGLEPEAIGKATTSNACRLFGIPLPDGEAKA